jgi:hypothetical protein
MLMVTPDEVWKFVSLGCDGLVKLSFLLDFATLYGASLFMQDGN